MSVNTFWKWNKNLIKTRLIEPLKKAHGTPIIKARGVAVGLAWAMTPLVGIQMYLVALTWGVCRRFKWSFSLPLALAWTWVTNVVTLPPVYYGFYVTGQAMRGVQSGDYGTLKHLINDTFMGDLTVWEQCLLFFKILLNDWGVSMVIGCVPWAIFFGLAGYWVTLKFEQRKEKHVNG